MGAASNESSQVLCRTIVFCPPIKISEVYSSIARLLSPTYGTYLITTCTARNEGKGEGEEGRGEGEGGRGEGEKEMIEAMLFWSLEVNQTVDVSTETSGT